MLFGETFAAFLAAVPIAGIGPLSSGLDAVATSIGAGVLLGGFVAGLLAQLGIGRFGQTRVAGAGYLGGLGAVALLLVDWAKLG